MKLKCLSGHDFIDSFDKFIEAPKFNRLFIKGGSLKMTMVQESM